MKTYFAVKNGTGATWPAYGMARLGAVLQYDGVNNDVPLYTLVKPDGAAGIYIVNGVGPLENTKEGTGIHYQDAQYVAVEAAEAAGVGVTIGAVGGQWTAGSIAGNGSQFTAVDAKNDNKIIPVTARATSSAAAVSGDCPCVCIENGDAVVNGITTTSRWSIAMKQETFKSGYGTIFFPAGSYAVILNNAGTIWELDIGDVLAAKYNDGTSATADTTMDGTLSMEWGTSGPVVKLCVDGAVPAPAVPAPGV
jgi:hypothetical protein